MFAKWFEQYLVRTKGSTQLRIPSVKIGPQEVFVHTENVYMARVAY
jgi:hypothetical protein